MVSYNGKVTFGAGHPVHKAGYDVEPPAPCVTRKMTPEERKFYDVDQKPGGKKGVVKSMKKKRGKSIDPQELESLIEAGYTAAEIAMQMDTEETVIWERAKLRGLVRKLRANETPAEEPDNDEEEIEQDFEEDTEAMPMHYPQDEETDEYRYIDAAWLDKIAEGLTTGAKKHPGETWKKIPAEEHAARAMRHLNKFRKGDRSEDHLLNASMRCMMADVLSRAED